ncbi:MAG: HRDC domain-containing protein [Planctomycetaceae bacterium]|nr:HRDC domain-containing protein [Planctomycetaceae bacterium]
MPGRLIKTQSAFDTLCDHIADTGLVAFDTEFVSESYYRPRLCLLQFATTEKQAIVDPFEIECLDRWWQLFADDETTVVAHGAREEVRFCLHFAQAPPRKLVDVQVAEGLLSRGFPLSYKALVQRVINERVDSHETRTDWGKRPLAKRQIDYALEDVEHLLRIWEEQQKALTKLGRLQWAWDEFERRNGVYAAEDEGERWRKVSGVHRLSRREMAIVRELFDWRDEQAQQRDKPPRTILRDDLITDLARRKPRSLPDVTTTRGMRSGHRRDAEDLFACVQRAMALPDDECPKKSSNHRAEPQEDVLAKLLGIALADRCSEFGLSQSIVGSMSDLQDLVRWHAFKGRTGSPPLLLQGWRAEVCGNVLTDLLDGRVSIRVADYQQEAPLCFEPVE